MKKILLCGLSLLLTSGLSFAQTFDMEHAGDTVTKAFTTVGNDLKISNKFINLTNSPITIDWRLIGSDLNNGWVLAGVCDNHLCYTSTNQIAAGVSTDPIAAMDTIASFYAWFNGDNANNNSAAWIRVEARDQATPLATPRTLTFVATKGTLSTVNVSRSEEDIVLYPNPAKNAVNVVYSADLGIKNVGVYNLIGKMVSVYKVGNTSAKLDINELPSGIYFLRLFDAQGRVVATRKFTHQQ